MNTKLLIAVVLSLWTAPLMASDLSAQFANPPAAARPWVYWFWNNGNVTKAGITADPTKWTWDEFLDALKKLTRPVQRNGRIFRSSPPPLTW